MTTAPYHLAKFDTTEDSSFNEEEVYRRCPFGNKPTSATKEELFLDIRWDDLLGGLSVNRSKYASPEDALWAPSEDEKEKKCSYIERKGRVYSSDTNYYPTLVDPNTGVNFCLVHTPINCNISHCDIKVENLPTGVTTASKRDIKAFLATFFQEMPKDDPRIENEVAE